MELYMDIKHQMHKDGMHKKYVPMIENSIKHHNLFNNPNNKASLIRDINSQLNESKTKSRALQELKILLANCTPDVYNQHGEKWLCICSEILASNVASFEMKKDASVILSLLMKNVLSANEFQHSVNTTHAKNLIPHLIKAVEQGVVGALECLNDYAVSFPNHFISYKLDIEQLMLKSLDHPLTECSTKTMLIGQLYGRMPPPLGENNAKRGLRGKRLHSLVDLLTKLCNKLFENVLEKEVYEANPNCPFNLEELPKDSDPTIQIFQGVVRISNALHLIYQQFNSYSNDNLFISFEPFRLVRSFLRILQVEVNSLKNQKGHENLTLGLLLPTLHLIVFQLLEKIMLRPSLAYAFHDYWGMIFQQMISNLKASQYSICTNSSAANNETGIRLRSIIYRLLKALIKVSAGSISITTELLEIIYKDLALQSETLNLQMTKMNSSPKISQSKGGNRKKRKLNMFAMELDHQRNSTMVHFSHESIMLKANALELLETICSYSINCTYAVTKDLQQGLMELCRLVFYQQNRGTANAIFNEEPVRIQLLKSLVSLCVNPRLNCLPPYLFILNLLENQMLDANHKVADICQNGIQTISFIMANPTFTTEKIVQNPLEDISNDVDENMQNDEIPSSKSKNDTINKKRRLSEQEVPSQISQSKRLNFKKDEVEIETCVDDSSSDDDVDEQMDTSHTEKTNQLADIQVSSTKAEQILNGHSVPNQTEDINDIDDDNDEDDDDSESSDEDSQALNSVQDSNEPVKNLRANMLQQKKDDTSPSVDEMLATFVDADPDDSD